MEEALAARQVAGINPAAAPVERPPPLSNVLGDGLPDHLTCPVSLDLMEDPAVLAVDGCTYSRTAIERYFAARRHGMWVWVCDSVEGKGWLWLGRLVSGPTDPSHCIDF